MNDEHTSIHDFDFNLICEYFSQIERQGPGSPEMTLKALSFIPDYESFSKIADIGCGTGGQTMVLGKQTKCGIIGIDLFPRFVEIFNQNAERSGLAPRLRAETGNMENLRFAPEELDLIWSEGAIYNIGFERGLNEWKKFLKKGGYIAVSEACWLTNERPKEIGDFWKDAYPEIDTIANKTAQLQKAGYVPLASFLLPEYCWIDNFYVHQQAIQESFLQKHSDNNFAAEFVRNERREAALYHEYKAFYGYVFFIGKKL